MKAFNYFSIVLAIAAGGASVARADLMQVCVDTSGDAYVASVAGFPKSGEPFNGTLKSHIPTAIANGAAFKDLAPGGTLDDATEGSVLETLYYSLKHELAVGGETSPTLTNYGDEPRVYKKAGVTILCSSTINKAEFDSLSR